jgi:hypothetical protein
MDHKGSLPYLQQPTTCLSSQPNQSSSYPPSQCLLRSILLVSSHLNLGLPCGLCRLLYKTAHAVLFCPIRSSCPANLTLLPFINLMMFREENKSNDFSQKISVTVPIAFTTRYISVQSSTVVPIDNVGYLEQATKAQRGSIYIALLFC